MCKTLDFSKKLMYNRMCERKIFIHFIQRGCEVRKAEDCLDGV